MPAEHVLWEAMRAGHRLGWHFRGQQITDGFIDTGSRGQKLLRRLLELLSVR